MGEVVSVRVGDRFHLRKLRSKNSQANEPQTKAGRNDMVLNRQFLSRQFLRSVSAIALIVSSVAFASAQQTIAPQSATPVPGPVPEILQKYAPVTAERLKKPED